MMLTTAVQMTVCLSMVLTLAPGSQISEVKVTIPRPHKTTSQSHTSLRQLQNPISKLIASGASSWISSLITGVVAGRKLSENLLCPFMIGTYPQGCNRTRQVQSTTPETTATTEASTTPETTITAEPSTTPETTATTEASTTPETTATTEASTTPETTTTTEPSTTTETTTTSEPSTTTETTTTNEPSTTTATTTTNEPKTTTTESIATEKTTEPSTTTATIAPTPDYDQCRKDTVADVILLIDSSKSVGAQNWQTLLNFVSRLTKDFQLGPSNVRFAAMTYGFVPTKLFDLKTYSDYASIEKSLKKAKSLNAKTMTYKAYEYIRINAMFGAKAGGRPFAPDFIVIFIQGDSENPAKTLKAAEDLKHDGVSIIGVGIGQEAPVVELSVIAKSQDDVIVASGYDSLHQVETKIVRRICQGAVGTVSN